ncbi:MAG: hypothetical protein KF742_09230 [Cryobacterium sp.]|nr:hypothetical protein [Cryobacterium sp.]MBX3116356.1 hypothetical protein [Cryobacterium sp.]MCC7127430.1 hypothetical protein [Microbacteriaceae bacterium]MCO5295124.1 hypothetical protein [Homoserinimonas sp.]
MSIPASASAPGQRSPQQIAHENALGEISDVLLNLEHTIDRSKKALARVRKAGGDSNVEIALVEALADLQRVHKRLMQDTYYAGDSVRLI